MSENGSFDFVYAPIKEKIKEAVSHITYSTYLADLVPVEVDGRFIVLQTPSKVFADYITVTLATKIQEAIAKASVAGITDFKLKIEGEDGYCYAPEEEHTTVSVPTNINPNFTFESYVVGKNNEFVYAAAQSVAHEPAGNFNPLFIYGGTGLGKTHLIHAIANVIIKEKPHLNVIYVTCEQFVNEIIDTMFTSRGAESRDKSTKLRQHYRSADILLIDDVQFIENKKAVQEEFFHTFNDLVSRGKQVIITSDHSPKELITLEERLRTRFSGGLVSDILPPNYETKIAILKRKAFEKKCLVPEDVLNFLAKDSGDDVRTLEGRLTKVIFASKLHEQPITIELAKSALNEAISEKDEEEATANSIVEAVCNYYHIQKSDLTGKSKKKDVVVPRQICCYLMYDLLSLPLTAIGKELGGRDHTTILYSRDKIVSMMQVSDKIAKEVDDIKNIVLKK